MVNNKDIVKYTPIVTAITAQTGTLSHIFRMVREKTAAGQSITAWLLITISILLWVNWYRIMTPDHKLPYYTTLISVFVNLLALCVVIYFRYFHV